MAKKFVRGITDVKTINNQDFDTNNVNDLLSDGQYNYIHRKKGENEEYHNLTDNIKTLSSDNTELLSVTNYNKTTNTATLSPKHDTQKEQLLESTRNTITINHGENGTAEKTTVDTNPQKVLEHENLQTDYGISKKTTGNTTTLGLKYTRVQDGFDLNNLLNGCVRAGQFVNAPKENTWYFVSAFTEDEYTIQHATSLTDTNNKSFLRLRANNVWGEWREQVGDKSVIDGLLAQKQDVLTAGDGLTTSFNTDETTIMFKATKKPPETNLNTLGEGVIYGNGFSIEQVPGGYQNNSAAYVTMNISENKKVQFHIRESGLEEDRIRLYSRFIKNGEVTEWKQMVGDSGELNNQLTQKQNTLTSNTSIGVLSNNTLSQLYTSRHEYTHTNGVLKTHTKVVASNTDVATLKDEYNFTLKINKGSQEATFTLNEHDKTKFNNIITTYGVDSSVRINGCLFTLSDATLTVSTEASTVSNHVITFSDII